MTASPVKRPGGVTFLGVLVIISGILYLISGCWRRSLIAGSGSSSGTDLTSNQRTR